MGIQSNGRPGPEILGLMFERKSSRYGCFFHTAGKFISCRMKKDALLWTRMLRTAAGAHFLYHRKASFPPFKKPQSDRAGRKMLPDGSRARHARGAMRPYTCLEQSIPVMKNGRVHGRETERHGYAGRKAAEDPAESGADRKTAEQKCPCQTRQKRHCAQEPEKLGTSGSGKLPAPAPGKRKKRRRESGRQAFRHTCRGCAPLLAACFRGPGIFPARAPGGVSFHTGGGKSDLPARRTVCAGWGGQKGGRGGCVPV